MGPLDGEFITANGANPPHGDAGLEQIRGLMLQKKPTLFVVDDEPTILDLFREIAETIRLDIETYPSAHDFLKSCDPDRPGCLVLDVRLPDMNGIQLLAALGEHGIRLPVIMISGHADIPTAVRAVKAGAMDFLEKPFRQQDVIDRIHAAFAQDKDRRRRELKSQDYASQYETLTPREREVMKLMVTGKPGKIIAQELGISYKTMEKFRGKVMRKMHAGGLVPLVHAAIQLGLVTDPGGAEGSH